MAVPIQDKVFSAIHTAKDLYHRLVLLVGESGSGKTSVLRAVAEKLGVEVINVNLELSTAMLEMTVKQRAVRLPALLEQTVEKAQTTVILDNIEILFDKELKQDPLRLLQGISRNRSVLASWNGTMDRGKLIYAKSDHPEHRSYDVGDTLIVGMDGTSSFDI